MKSVRRFLPRLATLVLLAGCAAGGSSSIGGRSNLIDSGSAKRLDSSLGLQNAKPTYRFYVTNATSNTVTTYKEFGTETKPTITGLNGPKGVAVDAIGKIYVANSGTNEVLTYNPDGSQATPTISGLKDPTGVAVDTGGKIYVTSSGSGTLTTYNQDGSQAEPTIDKLKRPAGVAVAANGEIFVADTGANVVLSFNADGSPSRRYENVVAPTGVALADGDGLLYVVESGMLTTFAVSSGEQGGPTITGLQSSQFVAVSPTADLKIFIANPSLEEVEAFTKFGLPTKPTFSKGLDGPTGIAVR